MLALDRRAARYAWTVALVVLLLVLFYLVRKTLFIFVIAVLFAYLLSPLVNFLDRILPSRTRTPALAIAYVLVVGLLVFAGIEIGVRVVAEANLLVEKIPVLLKQLEQPPVPVVPAVKSFKDEILERVRQQVQEHGNELLSQLPKAGLKVLGAATNLVYVVVIPILSFFFLKDGRMIRDHALDLMDEGPRREILNDVLADVHLLLAHYMRALLILCVVTFVSYNIFFAIARVPFGVLLAALAFALEFIPMIGPLVSSLTILLVGGLNGANVLALVIFLVAYRMFQDYLLSPHLMSSGVKLHPLLTLFGVFAGAEIAGIPGAFLSVPVLALLRIFYIRMRKEKLAARFNPVSMV